MTGERENERAEERENGEKSAGLSRNIRIFPLPIAILMTKGVKYTKFQNPEPTRVGFRKEDV